MYNVNLLKKKKPKNTGMQLVIVWVTNKLMLFVQNSNYMVTFWAVCKRHHYYLTPYVFTAADEVPIHCLQREHKRYVH